MTRKHLWKATTQEGNKVGLGTTLMETMALRWETLMRRIKLAWGPWRHNTNLRLVKAKSFQEILGMFVMVQKCSMDIELQKNKWVLKQWTRLFHVTTTKNCKPK